MHEVLLQRAIKTARKIKPFQKSLAPSQIISASINKQLYWLPASLHLKLSCPLLFILAFLLFKHPLISNSEGSQKCNFSIHKSTTLVHWSWKTLSIGSAQMKYGDMSKVIWKKHFLLPENISVTLPWFSGVSCVASMGHRISIGNSLDTP